MKFVTISDTHGKHAELELPAGDVLIHAGDISMKGTEDEVFDFINWFKHQDFKYKIFIAGNHDFYFERAPKEVIEQIIPDDIIYLEDSYTIIDGYKIWGSPITPWFFNWAFNRHRGEAIKKHWELIPDDTNILITHGPLSGILDTINKQEHVGCKDLFNKIQEVKPQIHLFGHIHESYGIAEKAGTKFINASVLNAKYELANSPIEFDL
ncbi:MAG: metallophosphatase domain-containing protein [Chitinophagaceae bacterium]